MSVLDTVPLAATALVDDVAGRSQEIDAAFREGYQLGHASGWEIGHQHAHHEIDQQQRNLAEHVHLIAGLPSHAEMEDKRYPGYTRERLLELRGEMDRRIGLGGTAT